MMRSSFEEQSNIESQVINSNSIGIKTNTLDTVFIQDCLTIIDLLTIKSNLHEYCEMKANCVVARYAILIDYDNSSLSNLDNDTLDELKLIY